MSAAILTIDAVLARLEKVHQTGSRQWTARCPSHDDRYPSLSVGLSPDDKILLHCNAPHGCTFDSILAALDLASVPRSPASNGHANGHRIEHHPAPIVAEYAAITADGVTVGRHMRKDFLDANGKPWRLKQVWWADHHGRSSRDMPLYNLPELLKAPEGATVDVTEGEKACDALRRHGVLAVATMCGASVTPCDESLRPLVGYDVVLWPDNDPAGEEHMRLIVERLMTLGGHARTLRWPDAPPKGDAADYFACGGTVEGLAQLVTDQQATEQTKVPTTPEDAQQNGQGIFAPGGHLRAVSLADVQAEKVEWLDKGYIPRGKITGLIGDPGLGKSTLSLHYVACHTTGGTWPGGTQNAPANAVLMSAEDGLADTIKPRLIAAGADVSRVTALTHITMADEEGHPTDRGIFVPRDLPAIRAAIQQCQATLLVIDPLTAYLDPDVNSHRDQDVRTALAPLARMADETGCAVLLVRHLNKAAGGNTLYRAGGSIGITGAERAELIVAVDPDDEDKRVVAVHKHNLHKPVPALCFELDEKDESPFVRWLGESPHTAAQLLAVPSDPDVRSETDEAAIWLGNLLHDNGGSMAADDVRKANEKGQGPNYSRKVLRSARERICLKPEKADFHAGWVWKLKPAEPPKMPTSHEDAQSEDAGTFEGGGHLRHPANCMNAQHRASGWWHEIDGQYVCSSMLHQEAS